MHLYQRKQYIVNYDSGLGSVSVYNLFRSKNLCKSCAKRHADYCNRKPGHARVTFCFLYPGTDVIGEVHDALQLCYNTVTNEADMHVVFINA